MFLCPLDFLTKDLNNFSRVKTLLLFFLRDYTQGIISYKPWVERMIVNCAMWPHRLLGNASYSKVDGMTALYLSGSGHAEVPAIAIDTISFTVSSWVKVLAGAQNYVFADWSSPLRFVFRVTSGGRVSLQLRHTSGTDILVATGGYVKLNFSRDRL